MMLKLPKFVVPHSIAQDRSNIRKFRIFENKLIKKVNMNDPQSLKKYVTTREALMKEISKVGRY